MDPITQQTTLAAAGAGGDKVYVDDVFSTFLYDGNSSTQTITNGIDLTGEGGLVWIKSREDGTKNHHLYDTERGAGERLSSNLTSGQVDGSSNELTAFTSSGFTLGISANVNSSSVGDYVSWSFRKAPGFFDVVTYTGNGVDGRTIAHNLGSVPGMIIIKNVSEQRNWAVYHRSLGATHWLKLDSNALANDYDALFDDTEPTSSVFTVGWDTEVNESGKSFVAYLFAHDDASFGTDGDESIIKCGSYTGNGSTGQEINLGFEAQWILFKCTSSGGNGYGWGMFDVMRNKFLFSESTSAEYAAGRIIPTANGFRFTSGDSDINESGETYIYMAIRRPNKPPEAGTEVFAIDTRGGTSPTPPTFNSGFPVDLSWRKDTTSSSWQVRSRLTGLDRQLILDLNNAEYDNPTSTVTFDRMDGTGTNTGVDSANYSWMFKRAPGFMDVVAYTGTGSNKTENHNLASTPEFIIVKRRSSTEDWTCYHSFLGNTKYITLNDSSGAGALSSGWNNTNPTSTNFTVGTHDRVNTSGQTYIAYLFATLPGISKVGSYTGNAGTQTIDCGFTNGARFVLIKQTDAANDWRLFDSVRGISSGLDSVISLNTSAGESNKSWIEPDSSGFKVNTTNDNVNGNNNSYIFLAIA